MKIQSFLSTLLALVSLGSFFGCEAPNASPAQASDKEQPPVLVAEAPIASPPASAGVATSTNTTAPKADVPAPSGKPGAWKPRTPGEIMREGNHLKDEGSVYLRQHAQNPLEWYPWGPEALARSKAENKPIFLSIGYSSCHWCHVMEHEVFEHEDVAQFMNANFICIKVDREERPDLDKVYMDAVQAMTGRGGWPMTVFLTPGLKPFMGGTYFPKRRFMPLAQKVLSDFRTKRSEVEASGQKYYEKIKRNPSVWGTSPLPVEQLQGMARQVAARIDPVWGGFKRQRTKFPVPSRWTYLMRAFRKWGGAEVGKATRLTLEQMASGGMYDHIAGGFHRYSTERTWLVPHFEKMLYDNGQLATLYIEAGAAFQEPKFDAIAKDVLEFMLRHMREPGAAFYSSWDADSGGHEGSYYVWTPSELDALAGPKDGSILRKMLGVTASGNFEGKTILTRRVADSQVASELGVSAGDVQKAWTRHRERLATYRDTRVKPGLDKKVVTAWNGLAIGAFAKGYQAFGDVRYRRAAEEAAEFIWTTHRRPTWGLYRASNGGVAEHAGILDDYAVLADALLDLAIATGDLKHLGRAKILMQEARQHFGDAKGAWFFTEKGLETPLGRQVVPWDSVRPSGMSRLLQATLRLAALTGSDPMHGRVDQVLAAYASQMRGSGLGMAGWYSVALANHGPFYEVIFAGDPTEPTFKALKAAYRALRPSWAVQIDVPAQGPGPKLLAALPTTRGKVAKQGEARAYVCIRGTCNAPTGDPAVLRAQLLKGWTR